MVVMFVAVLALTILPETALACPVCFDANAENRMAFLATTALLTLLPIGLLGGVGLWLRKRARSLRTSRGDGLPERNE